MSDTSTITNPNKIPEKNEILKMKYLKSLNYFDQ